MSDDFGFSSWSSLSAFDEGAKRDSREEVNEICDALQSMPFPIYVPERAASSDQYVLGHSGGEKMFRLELGGGVLVQPLRQQSEFTEEGYIYQTPSFAIGWLLSKLGYGSNATNFESDVLMFESPKVPRPVRIAFEQPLNETQIAFYESLGDVGFELADSNDGGFGVSLVDELKEKH